MATTKTTVQEETYVDKHHYVLNMSDLKTDPNQPRKYFDIPSLYELKDSIVKHGVLSPVLFRQEADGTLILVAGERRYRASVLAENTTIPAIFTKGNAAEIAIIENLLRENLNPIEEAEAIERLKTDAGYTQGQLTSIINKAQSTISEILSLNKLPKKIKEECRENPKVSRRALVQIAKAPDEKTMKKLFRQYKDKDLTSNQVATSQREARDLDAVLMTMIGGLKTKLSESNLDDIGDDAKRSTVETNLLELNELIQEKLNSPA